MTHEVDVLVVGSGPAGCSTALHLARMSPTLAARTVVLEKSAHPRHKLCGGGLVSDVDVVLGDLGLDPREVAHVDAQWAHLLFRGRGPRVKLSDIAFHVVRRREFDAWLADRVRDCGVPLLEHTQVHALTPVPGGMLVETSRGDFRARAVVGADGTKGVVRRAVTGDRGAVARLLEVMLPPPPQLDPPLPADEAVFEFGHVLAGVQGYFWSFPMEIDGRPMRNLGLFDSRVVDDAPLAGSLKQYLEQDLARHGVRLEDCKLEGHPIHLYSPRSALATPHVLLAGDAAGADPLLGEGISLALGYGRLAARALVDAFTRDDLSFADYTGVVHHSALGRSLRNRHAAARLLYRLRHPLLQRALFWHLQPLVRRFIREHMFRWARPQPLPPRSAALAAQPAA